ncbi:hypothetical protein [Niabella hibiscisoli]|uniref:hypothetical protein n=1 Tax=Niabella hibiscisoli TaxID=1825928 RepID=UPI001F0D5C83|nr:hypothetical protein [Niabella hibiscisoli]MCH5717523.1 hypothetical protein [Niabella hibiscisoli]
MAVFCSADSIQSKKPANFILGSYPATTPGTSYAIAGFGNDYATGTTFTLNYGRINATTVGLNRVVKLFNVEGESYTFTKAVPGARPFNSVFVRRSNTDVKTTSLFETGSRTGNTVNLAPDYSSTMEDLINSYVINRGTDNVFINTGGNTTNNIERFDLILANPVDVSRYNPNTSGFLLMERNGNDIFKVSAITGFNSAGNTVTALNTPATVNIANWGSTGYSFESVVMQRRVTGTTTDTDLKPSQTIAAQNISGVFVTLAQLGITSGTLYGVSFFGGDVSLTNTQLLTISNYPTNTAETGNFGIDFMAGGGFFTRAVLIQGTVWNDANNNAIRGTGENGIANDLWANLVSPSGAVVSSLKVNANGTYTTYVASNSVVTGEYKVILTNSEKYEGATLSAADNPLNGYNYTGVNVGGVANTSNKTGIINLGQIYRPLYDDIADVSGIDFGIRNPALPITLGGFNAILSANQLSVTWTTTMEKSNLQFDIEASADGNQFTKIGTVHSKAVNGDSDKSLDYEFILDLDAHPLAFAWGSLALAGALLLSVRKQKIASVLFLTGVMAFCGISCTKQDGSVDGKETKVFIRLKQINKDGTFEYSKTIQAVKNNPTPTI